MITSIFLPGMGRLSGRSLGNTGLRKLTYQGTESMSLRHPSTGFCITIILEKEHSGYVQDVSISANGSNVAAVFVPGNLRLYNHEGKKFWDYQLSKTPPARSNVVLSDNGRFVAVNEGGYLNYFNEWGNATVIIDEVILNTTISTKELSDVSSHSTPASSPLSVFFVIAALLLCAIIIFCWKKI
jgi:hypothetical protein